MRVLGARAARPVASSPRAPRKRRPCRSRAALRTAPAPPGNPGAPSAASASAGGCSGWGRPEGASFPGAPRAKGTFWPLPHPRALSGVVLPSPAEVSWAPEAILSDGECSGFSGTCASGCGLAPFGHCPILEPFQALFFPPQPRSLGLLKPFLAMGSAVVSAAPVQVVVVCSRLCPL